MNGIEGGVELVTTSGLTHLSTPVSIYTLKLYIPNGNDEMALIQCACGCGTWIEGRDKRGRTRRFVNGHYRKLIKGDAHPFFGKKHTDETKGKISEALKGKPKHRVKSRPQSEGTKRKIREAHKGKKLSEETKHAIGESNKGKHAGKKNPNYGKQLSEETREKIGLKLKGKTKTEEQRRKLRGHHHTEEAKRRIREAKKGEKNPNWAGGISFEPYCPKFSDTLKEEIRDKFGRKCFICPKTEEEEGRKLSVHHVDYNKEQGCNGVHWLLVPLCRSCNSKLNFNRDYWQDLIIEKLKQGGYLN